MLVSLCLLLFLRHRRLLACQHGINVERELVIGLRAHQRVGNAVGAQVLLLPEEQITGRASVSLGAARALDPDTTSTALMAVLMRVDVFTLWVTFLVAVGLRVVGRVPMSKALVAAGVVWVLGGLFTFLTSGLAG